jgi:hypothetical protein
MLLAGACLLAPATALASPYTVAKRAALTRGRQLAHHPVRVESLMHVWGRKWYAQDVWTSPGSEIHDNCLLELYIWVYGNAYKTKVESKSCF